MDSEGRRRGGGGIPGLGDAVNKTQGQAGSFHLAPEQSTRGGQREMRSARLASGAGMPRKGIWIGFLASGGFRQEWGWQWDESLCLCCGWRREERGRRPEVGHQRGRFGAWRRVWVRDGKGQARGESSSSSRGRSGSSGQAVSFRRPGCRQGPDCRQRAVGQDLNPDRTEPWPRSRQGLKCE